VIDNFVSSPTKDSASPRPLSPLAPPSSLEINTGATSSSSKPEPVHVSVIVLGQDTFKAIHYYNYIIIITSLGTLRCPGLS